MARDLALGNGARPALSVVVMGYRDEPTIVRAVESVVEQISPEPFEVVVVTSGGDGSAAAVRAAFPDLTLIDSPRRLLPGAARNAGAEAASGELVAFLAADCEALPGWVATRVATHRRGHPVVAGAMTTRGPARPWAWASHFDLFCARLPGRPAGVVSRRGGAAYGLSFHRSVLERIGPFDERRVVGEDTDAAHRLVKIGVEVWFEPAVRTAHSGPQGTVALLRDQHRRGRGAASYRAREFPAITIREALMACGPRWWRGLRQNAATSWRYGRDERWRLMASLPWLAAARTAAVAGWYRERLRDPTALNAAG